MACLQILRSGFSPALALRVGSPSHRFARPASLPFRCRLRDDDNDASNGEEKPESLFLKELRRRGMTPTSLKKESGRQPYGVAEEGAEAKEEVGGGGRARRNGVASADYEKATSNQRERSMALNSEGLEGLIPRAKLLLTIGGTFFMGFWPLILMTFMFSGALYLYFGPSFVHDASKMPGSPPPYIDPYTLLEDEKLSQVAPYVK